MCKIQSSISIFNIYNRSVIIYTKSRRMKKTISIIDNDLHKNFSDFSKSIVLTQGDSMKSISDCTTVVSEIDFMEENSESRINHDLETSFKKQLTKSCLESNVRNPNMKKSRILVVQSRIISQEQPSSRGKQLTKQAVELQSIEKKTEDLVLKEKQQRKELKKLKKLYVQKLDELMKQQQAHLLETTNLNHQIDGLLLQKTQLLREKEAIQQTMKTLQSEVDRTKQQINNFKIEKQHLIHRLELFDANFTQRSTEKLGESILLTENSSDLQRQINIIDRSILRSKKEGNENELSRLLQIKIDLLERRQQVKVNQQCKKQERLISQLNQIISSRNNLLKSKNHNISQLEKTVNEQATSTKEEKQLQTSESFFSKPLQNCEGNDESEDDSVHQWDQFKHSVRKLIQSNRIRGYEESYEVIQSIVMGMIHLFENETCCQDDVLELLETCLDNLSSKYISKAKSHIDKIQLLLNFIKSKGRKYEMAKFSLIDVRQKENQQYKFQRIDL